MASPDTLVLDLTLGGIPRSHQIRPAAMTVLGRGGVSVVYAFDASPASRLAIKIFNRPERAPWDKIRAEMEIAQTKVGTTPEEGYLIAWPQTIVRREVDRGDVGIALCRFDKPEWQSLDNWVENHLIGKLSSTDDSLSRRILILRNCAAALAKLHASNHAVVDFKPANILVSRKTGQVFILDPDSFRIVRNERVFPATHVSPGYILPSAYGDTLDISRLGITQDRYALAVIIFEVLNYGIHPFQGIIEPGLDGIGTNDEKARCGLYSYGISGSRQIKAMPRSVHACWPTELRRMLDRAFCMPDTAPTAEQWRDLLTSLLDRRLNRCQSFPADTRHICFNELPCMACLRQASATQRVRPNTRRGQTTQIGQTTHTGQTTQTGQATHTGQTTQTGQTIQTSKGTNPLGIVAVITLVLIALVLVDQSQKAPVVTEPKHRQQQSAQPETSQRKSAASKPPPADSKPPSASGASVLSEIDRLSRSGVASAYRGDCTDAHHRGAEIADLVNKNHINIRLDVDKHTPYETAVQGKLTELLAATMTHCN